MCKSKPKTGRLFTQASKPFIPRQSQTNRKTKVHTVQYETGDSSDEELFVGMVYEQKCKHSFTRMDS